MAREHLLRNVILLIVAIVVAEGVLVGQIVQNHLRDEITMLHKELDYVCKEAAETARITGNAIVQATHKTTPKILVKCPK